MAERGDERRDLSVCDRGERSRQCGGCGAININPQLAVGIGAPDPGNVPRALSLGKAPFPVDSLTFHAQVTAPVALGKGVNDPPVVEMAGAIVAGELDRALAGGRRYCQPPPGIPAAVGQRVIGFPGMPRAQKRSRRFLAATRALC